MAIIDKIQLSGTVYTIGNETTTAVTSASTDNEIPTAKAVYDAIPQGGGGKAINAGTNISIITGETADTINCTLPIVMKNNNMMINSNIDFANNLSNCFTFGAFNTVGNGNKCSYLFTFGSDNNMSASNRNRQYRYAFGNFLRTQNSGEIAFSKFNVSSSASETFGDSGNTLFSVGNGTSSSKRHNAFEIRQNGDIYITKDGQDVKLQDQLGGGGSITVDPSLDSDSTNPVANSAITETLGKYYYPRKFNNSVYSSPWTQHSSNGCVGFGLEFANILNPNDSVISEVWLSKINGKQLFYAEHDAPNADVFNLNLVETSAITTSVSSESTDSQVPSAKAVYDMVGNINTILESI